VNATLVAGVEYTLTISLKDTTVSVSLNGSMLLGTYFNAPVVDGAFGVLAKGGEGTFDVFRYQTNDDAWRSTTPRISIGDAVITEGASGTSVVTITLLLSSAAPAPASVRWSTANGTATAGSDFVGASGTATFAAGSLSNTISISVLGDGTLEADEIFKLLLSDPAALILTDNAALVTIANDDGATTPKLSVADASIVEGNSGTKTLLVTVTLSAASTTPVTVTYATSGGTATAGTDYVSSTGTLTFAPGTTSRTISVTIKGDRTTEPNETFQVVLSNASVGIAKGTAVLTILDDERALTVSGTASGSQPATELTLASADAAIGAALGWWQREGADRTILGGVSFVVTDLADELLALAAGNTVYLDTDAAGFGWSLDAYGRDDGRIDLTSVLIHELGHVLGFDHDDADTIAVMQENLDPGTRYVLGKMSTDPIQTAPAIMSHSQSTHGVLDFANYSRFDVFDANATFDAGLGLIDSGQGKRLPYEVGKTAKSAVLDVPVFQSTPFFKDWVAKRSDGLDRLGRPLL
jgi:hypothetical protein